MTAIDVMFGGLAVLGVLAVVMTALFIRAMHRADAPDGFPLELAHEDDGAWDAVIADMRGVVSSHLARRPRAFMPYGAFRLRAQLAICSAITSTQVWADRNAGRFDSALGSPARDHPLSGGAGLPTLATPHVPGAVPAAAPAAPGTTTRLLDRDQRLQAEIEATRPWAEDTGSFAAIAEGWNL